MKIYFYKQGVNKWSHQGILLFYLIAIFIDFTYSFDIRLRCRLHVSRMSFYVTIADPYNIKQPTRCLSMGHFSFACLWCRKIPNSYRTMDIISFLCLNPFHHSLQHIRRDPGLRITGNSKVKDTLSKTKTSFLLLLRSMKFSHEKFRCDSKRSDSGPYFLLPTDGDLPFFFFKKEHSGRNLFHPFQNLWLLFLWQKKRSIP